MTDAPTRSNRGLWIAIVVLAGALVATTVALVGAGDRQPPPPSMRGDAGVVEAPPEDASASTSAIPPLPPADPKEAAARERLLVLSHALDLWFRQKYEFPDRLEVLIANDLAKPADFNDPWGRAVDYTRVAKERFKLCSRGPDATSYTDDDVCIGPGGRSERPGR